jgi:hypothetical protein
LIGGATGIYFLEEGNCKFVNNTNSVKVNGSNAVNRNFVLLDFRGTLGAVVVGNDRDTDETLLFDWSQGRGGQKNGSAYP